MRSIFRAFTAAALAALLLIASGARADDLFAVIQKTPELSTLTKLIEAAGLAGDLKSAPTLTILAPTNDAFAKLPKEKTDELLKPENKATLRAILLYHALGMKLTQVDIRDLPVGSKGPSAAVPALTLTSVDPIIVNEVARIVKADLMAENGVIHEIDTVLLPPSATAKPAPAPAPAAKAPAGATIMTTATENLAALIARVPELSLFSRYIRETGLADSLAKRGPLTVFAPTNAALTKTFRTDNADVMIAYLKKSDATETILVPTLNRHVVAGAYAAADLAGGDGQTLTTVERGVTLKVATRDGKVLVNGVSVVRADLPARNGIVHIVDSVLPK